MKPTLDCHGSDPEEVSYPLGARVLTGTMGVIGVPMSLIVMIRK